VKQVEDAVGKRNGPTRGAVGPQRVFKIGQREGWHG
jgi:hypothetical protein